MASNLYKIRICNDCLNTKGEMCHNPDCILFRKTMKEAEELLDALMIKVKTEEKNKQNNERN